MVFEGWRDFLFERSGAAKSLRLTGSDEKGTRWTIGDVRKVDQRWEAELVEPKGEILFHAEVESEGAGKIALQQAAELHGAQVPISFGLWVSRAREKRKWSQSKLARIAGLDHTTIRSVESGAHPPNETTRHKLETVLSNGKPEGDGWRTYMEERVEKLERKIELMQRRGRAAFQ